MMILGTMPMVEVEGCLSKVLEYLESLKYAEANELLASLLGRPCWRSRKMYDEIPVLEVKDAVCSLAEVLDRCLPIGSEWRTKAVSDPAGFVEHMMSFLHGENEYDRSD